MKKYKEFKQLNLPEIDKEILEKWKKEDTFKQSVSTRAGKPNFVFYEGPPSANGLPGIHHVMARSIKDIFCRYKTIKGFKVERKAGWDTHGLPVELGVEKSKGITKDDIGNLESEKYISIEDYNQACRTDVMKYTGIWNDLTEKMGYWVDMENPYITYENKYIESVWWLLKKLHSGENALGKKLLYKEFSIQPYSPAAGTGLSSHELNQPGCYRDVKDTSVVAMFEIKKGNPMLDIWNNGDLFFIAWTTTPWTLPSNTALAVGAKIDYILIKTFNQYTHQAIKVILAKDLMGKYFPAKNAELSLADYKAGDKAIPFKILAEFKGKDFEGIRYEQLMDYVKPLSGDAFRVILANFVTTDEGTGIVHIAPTFGSDDFEVAIDSNNNIPPMLVSRAGGMIQIPIVDQKGRYEKEIFDFAGEYVKEQYLTDDERKNEIERLKNLPENSDFNKLVKDIVTRENQYLSIDERITLKLKLENRAFKIEKYEHSYPHCWRTDKPIIYYPLLSWFIKTTAAKNRLIELNNSINWIPKATGSGRFGNWLENIQDWNLSRSRFWGIPLPIWRVDPTRWDMTMPLYFYEKCLTGIVDLKDSGAYLKVKSLPSYKGFNFDDFLTLSTFRSVFEQNFDAYFKKCIDDGVIIPLKDYEGKIDLHRPFVDNICFYENGELFVRESDLIDVWFDSGAMPYAQLHYPFENAPLVDNKTNFPADFIAEGVDQTRGWFYTLHVISTLVFDSVAYKNVVSNGLVLDKNGQKMSKRLGNAVDPFKTIENFGADAVRWYMISNAQPWDNLKFDEEGISEVQRKFFRALFSTYNFFAIYANVDAFEIDYKNLVPVEKREELDRWIISKLQTLKIEVDAYYNDYDPTKAARAIQDFVADQLSNWYIRLSRRRFWKGQMTDDKKAAYETLHECLSVVAQLMSPIAPFFADWLYGNLNLEKSENNSVHLSFIDAPEMSKIDQQLIDNMETAQKVVSLILSLRKKVDIKVRQPLQKVMIPILDEKLEHQLESVKSLILSEVNVKELEYLKGEKTNILVKKIKPNFKTLGKKFGKHMKAISALVGQFTQENIREVEQTGAYTLNVDNENLMLEREDFEILSEDIPGFQVASEGIYTVALDITITDELRKEGLSREFVNRIQNIRKESDFDLTDRISVLVEKQSILIEAIQSNFDYICAEILADKLEFIDKINVDNAAEIEIDEELRVKVIVKRI